MRDLLCSRGRCSPDDSKSRVCLQEAAACCPHGPVKQDVVRALREVSVKLMPSVRAAKEYVAKHGGVAAGAG